MGIKNYAYLKMVDVHNNNHKFYEIMENDDGSVDVNYGRIGATSVQHKHYGIHEAGKSFYQILDAKERKGYKRDDTRKQVSASTSDLTKTTTIDYKPIEFEPVKEVIDEFLRTQKQIVQKTFTTKVEHITQKQVDDAKFYLNNLKIVRNKQFDNPKYNLTGSFNEVLLKEDYMGKALPECLLFCVERRSNNVKDLLLSDRFSCSLSATEWKDIVKEMDSIISREEKLINALEGEYNQYKLAHPDKIDPVKKPKNNCTVLEANGIKMEEITYKEEDKIMSLLRKKNWQGLENLSRYNSSYKVEVDKTQGKYDEYCKKNNIKDKMFLWHGSITGNLWSILTTGLRIMPHAANGRAFGNGLYFANNSQKGANYTSARPNRLNGVQSMSWNKGNDTHGYLALFEVATGKPQIVTSTGAYYKNNYDSLWYQATGSGGFRDDEIVIYNDDACTLKYIVKIDSDPHPKHYNLNPSAIKLDNAVSELGKDKNGVYGILEITSLPDSIRNYWGNKFNTNASDTVKIYENKIVVNDKDVKFYEDNKPVTLDDCSYLFREVKKNFFEKESEYQDKVKNMKENDVMYSDLFEREDLEEDEREA